jgi:hypothetical protein
MTNHVYDQAGLIGFQVSFLSLAAALDLAASAARKEVSSLALVGAEQLRDLVDRCAG